MGELRFWMVSQSLVLCVTQQAAPPGKQSFQAKPPLITSFASVC